MLSSRIFLIGVVSLLSSAVYAQDPSVSWVSPPPTVLHKEQRIPLSWNVEDLPGSFHAICTFCPESLGPHCKKGYPRQQTEAFSASNQGHFTTSFMFDENTESGNYFAVAYGAYSPQSYHATNPIKVSYQNTVGSDSSSQNGTSSASSSSSSTVVEEKSSSTVIVAPPPVYGYWGWGVESDAVSGTINQEEAEQQSHENQSQRQEAASTNQQQRQETSTTNQQQRQDALTPNSSNQSQANSSHQRGSRSGGGSHQEGGHGGFGGKRGGRSR